MNSRTTGCSPTGFAGLPPAGPVGVSLALNVLRDSSPACSSQRTELLVTDRSLGRQTRGGKPKRGKSQENGSKDEKKKHRHPQNSYVPPGYPTWPRHFLIAGRPAARQPASPDCHQPAQWVFRSRSTFRKPKSDRSLGRLTRGGRFEKGKAHEIGPKNGRQKAKAPTTFTQIFKKRPTARVHYTLKPPVDGWTCYLTDFTQSVSGISSAASRHRRLSPGGLRVQRGAGALLSIRVAVDAYLLRAPLRIMEEQAIVVAVHGPAVFCPLRMELVVEGELNDVRPASGSSEAPVSSSASASP